MFRRSGDITLCMSRCLRLHQSNTHCRRFIHKEKSVPSSKEIRSTFIKYFCEKDHKYVHSSSVIPKKGGGTYFVNAGMNQFKPIFLGTVDLDNEMYNYRRAVNSQKCIRVGGKHNDLDDVGKDTYHHTFFEMLGSWSFGDYFKEEACEMAWDLLTERFGIPEDKLYVTYFGGNTDLHLEPDLECRDIWLQIGLPKERVLPFGMTDNFWDMGDTGPCGPCTEIHFNNTGMEGPQVAKLVNAGSLGVMEIWNLVFMQYDRQADKSLKRLPQHHVDTGMGLERLCAVLQGVTSNYDTDLFEPLFQAIHKQCQCPAYQGHLGSQDLGGFDTAYRIVADHARMATVAMTDGLRPGRKDLDFRLRQIIHRALRQAHQVLNASPGMFASLVPLVVDSLGEAFPELKLKPNVVIDLLNESEQKYVEQMKHANKALNKALKECENGITLSATEIQKVIEGRFGGAVNLEFLEDAAENAGIRLDLEAYHQHMTMNTENINPVIPEAEPSDVNKLSQQDLMYLKQQEIPATDDSYKYNRGDQAFFETQFAHVVGLKQGTEFVDEVKAGQQCGVLLDRTCFYAESGGQAPDVGYMITTTGCRLEVIDVQKTQEYVLHIVTISQGMLGVGDAVSLAIDQRRREQTACNHTATHLLNFAIRESLGEVRQAGSTVTHNKLTFDFTCHKSAVSNNDLRTVSEIANSLIEQSLPVHTCTLSMSEADSIHSLVKLDDAEYSRHVRVVSVGTPAQQLMDAKSPNAPCSVELCGGTHVNNTREVGSLVITNFQGVAQGTKRLTAVTGDAALKALENMRLLKIDMEKFETWIQDGSHKDWILPLSDLIEKSLSDGRPLPKVERDALAIKFEQVRNHSVRGLKNISQKEDLSQKLNTLLESDERGFIVATLGKTKLRNVAAVLGSMEIEKPVVLLFTAKDGGHMQGLCYVPKVAQKPGFTSASWAQHIANQMPDCSVSPSKDKKVKDLFVYNIQCKNKNKALLAQASEVARTFAVQYQSTQQRRSL